MVEQSGDLSDHSMFVTEFPKNGYGIVDYLQGRVHFALMDQMKLMASSGMAHSEIKETIITNITKIVDAFEAEK